MMRIFSEKEWAQKQYTGRWGDTPYNHSCVEAGELNAAYIGRRTLMVGGRNGTELLTEGFHFLVNDEEGRCRKFYVTHKKNEAANAKCGIYHGFIVEAVDSNVAGEYFRLTYPDSEVVAVRELRKGDMKPGIPFTAVPEGRWKGAGMGIPAARYVDISLQTCRISVRNAMHIWDKEIDMSKFPETVPEYNKVFQPAVKAAMSFVGCMNHAIEKTKDPEDVAHQLNCIGWSEAVKNTINNALSHYLHYGKRCVVLNRNFTENEIVKLVDMGNLVFSPNLTDQKAEQLLMLVRREERTIK